jgi:hypothetical protein
MKLSNAGNLATYIENGISVAHAKFHQSVDNSNKEPSTEFNMASGNAGRRIEMWLTEIGLVCLHKDEYFIVPTANIISVR